MNTQQSSPGMCVDVTDEGFVATLNHYEPIPLPNAMPLQNAVGSSISDNGIDIQTQRTSTAVTNHEESCKSPSDGNKGQGFVPFENISPSDVLFGRGPRANDNVGNVTFRRLVAARKAEYVDAAKHKEKDRIAKEIIDHVRCNLNPPGRFLAAVDRLGSEAMGFPANVEMWRVVDDKAVLEKTKQTLRQIKKWGGAELGRRPARRQVVETLASEEPRGSGEHGTKHTASANINSSTQESGGISRTGGSSGRGSGERSNGNNNAGVEVALPSACIAQSTGVECSNPESGNGDDLSDECLDDLTLNNGSMGRFADQEDTNLYSAGDVMGNGIHSGSSLESPSTSLLPVMPLATLDSQLDMQASDATDEVFVAALSDYEPVPFPNTSTMPLQNVVGSSISDNGIDIRTQRTSTAVTNHAITTEISEEAQVDSSNQQVGRDNVLESIHHALQLAKEFREGSHGNQGVVFEGDSNGYGSPSDKEHINRDLVTFGQFLYKHFAGVEAPNQSGSRNTALEQVTTALAGSSVSDDFQMKKRERQPNHQQGYTPLRDMGFPVSLCILVSSLMSVMDNGSVYRYKTADEVVEDLRLMTIDPERYLFDTKAYQQTGRLEFNTGRLHGRERDVEMLLGVFECVIGSDHPCPTEIVLITGHSGTGKSILVEQLRRPLLEKKGHFICVKFDELGQTQPMSALLSAFNDFCAELLEGDVEILAQVRSSIEAELGSHCNILFDLIPELRNVVSESASNVTRLPGMEGLNQFIFYFCFFVRAIAKPSHPLVLFLDDLQWADKESLELLAKLASDRMAKSSMFVGCYRDNEIGPEHPLKEVLGKFIVSRVALTTMKLGNISRESVNALLSDSLHLSPRVTRPLADVVYAKTSGLPLFAVQFLRSLCGEHLLQYSARSRQWEWDVDSIMAKDVADNVVDLMKQKMQKLHPDVQWLLKVASCLGSRSEASTLKLLSSNDRDDGSCILPYFDLAVNEGLMSKVGSRYKFSHDQIQQAAYSSIPLDERKVWHLRVGRILWKNATEKQLNEIVFIVVDQLYRGSDLITDHDEKIKVARLCLTAGEMAMSSSAFLQASICLLQGSALLEESDWEDHYNLSLELFTCCAEAQYVTGAYEVVALTSNPILAKGKCLQDKLRAYYALVNSLGCQEKQLEAIRFGLEVLADLGEFFPNDIERSHVMEDYAKTRAMLEGTTKDDILQMNEMEDEKMLAVMKMLNLLSRYAYQVNQELFSLMIFRMLQLSIRQGMCRESPYALASFGLVSFMFGDLEQGYVYGKLALSLLQKLNAKEHLARVHLVVYGLINSSKDPVQACIPPLKEAYLMGMSTGDIEMAFTNASCEALMSLQSGCSLETLAAAAKAYTQQMQEHKHQMLNLTLLISQAILNLLGNSDDPTVLTGDAMNQDEILNGALEKGLVNVVNMVYFLRMRLAYLFRRYDVAEELIRRLREIRKSQAWQFAHIIMVDEIFYTGLIAAVIARDREPDEWRSMALESAEKMKTWAANSSWNFQHKLDLLNAEVNFMKGDLDGEAASAYNAAIRNAGEHNFVHEQALACERAGLFYSKVGNQAMAADYLERSRKYYDQWGAKSKAEDILKLICNMHL